MLYSYFLLTTLQHVWECAVLIMDTMPLIQQ